MGAFWIKYSAYFALLTSLSQSNMMHNLSYFCYANYIRVITFKVCNMSGYFKVNFLELRRDPVFNFQILCCIVILSCS